MFARANWKNYSELGKYFDMYRDQIARAMSQYKQAFPLSEAPVQGREPTVSMSYVDASTAETAYLLLYTIELV